MTTIKSYVDRLPDGAEGVPWLITCPPEKYEDQQMSWSNGLTSYIDFSVRLEATETHAMLRIYLSQQNLVPDRRRHGVFRLLGSPEAEFLTEDSIGTGLLVLIERGFVNLSGCIPDTPAGRVWITLPGRTSPTTRK